MDDAVKTKEQLLTELGALRQRLTVLEGIDTAPKQTEEDLRRLVEKDLRRLVTVVYDSNDAITVQDLQGRLLAWNRGAQQMYGYSEREALGKDIRALTVPPALHEEFTAFTHRITRGEEVESFETQRRTKAGQLLDVWLTVTVLVNDVGQPTEVATTERDITVRKRAEAALRHQRDWLEVTLASIGDGVIATDSTGAITFLNPVAERLTGWSAQEARGCSSDTVFRILNQHTHQPMESPVTRILREGMTVGLANHAVLLTRHGSTIPIADSGAPIRGSDGTLEGVVLIFRDISESLRMEEELLKARKIESVGVLAGGIAHDFNNLLTALMGNISVAQMFAGPNEKVVARLIEAEKACQRATALTHQLLTFAKGGEPVRHTASITALLSEAARFALHGSKSRCALAIPEDLWPVDVDIGQISQVIHNVVLNAAQAMPEGGTVQVQAENILLSRGCALPLPEGRYVKTVVKDHGYGIPHAELPNIFDPYFTTKEHGSGLGLATAYSIVTKHNGYITAASEVGVGTTLSIYLPASQQAIVMPQHAAEAPGSGSGRVLIMDDEEAIRDLLREMLTSLGYEVECTCDGAETIAAYQRATTAGEPFTVVILDHTIPGGMGGRETLERLRIIDPQVKAIISSGYVNDPMMANFAQYGFSDVVTKPYAVTGLHAVLQRVIGV